jgi:hypothetical protein
MHPSIADSRHPSLEQLQQTLRAEPVWFAAPERDDEAWSAELRGRMQLHRFEAAAALTVQGLSPADLPALAPTLRAAFLNHENPLLAHFDGHPVAATLAGAGMRLFGRPGQRAATSARTARSTSIGSLEFLVSDSTRLRLQREPGPAGGVQREASSASGRWRAVVVLDLIQDFEVLRPFLDRLAAADSRFEPQVAVSQRVQDSPLWAPISAYLEVQALPWFRPLGPADVSAALGSSPSLLLTASESSANGHRFNHTVCRTAPPRALRVTVQHGLECVGLRHHQAHDIDFPDDIRFASDLILTWADVDSLPSLHPAERDKCISVGVCKSLAEQAAVAAESDWARAAPRPAASRRSALIAENLHSVRFKDPSRYRRFKRFIEQACSFGDDLEVTIRSHPGKRTLESQQADSGYRFLEGLLKASDLVRFDRFVSPPSTVVLDAVLCGVPTTVWTDDPTGADAANYRALALAADFEAWHGSTERSRVAALSWAAGQTSAFNGAPAAWNLICQLLG